MGIVVYPNLKVRPILAAEVGINLIISQLAAHHSIDSQLILCDLSIAHAIYGRDRLSDQLHAINMTDIPITSTIIPTTVPAIIPTIVPIVTTSTCSLLASIFLILNNRPLLSPIITLLTTSYSTLKPKVATFKPFLVGALWAAAIVALPNDIPIDENLFIYYFLFYSAASNVADIKDIEEDKINNIITPSVILGKKASYSFSAILGSLAISLHDHISVWTLGDTITDALLAIFILYTMVKAGQLTDNTV